MYLKIRSTPALLSSRDQLSICSLLHVNLHAEAKADISGTFSLLRYRGQFYVTFEMHEITEVPRDSQSLTATSTAIHKCPHCMSLSFVTSTI
jgi:hypothetical protein